MGPPVVLASASAVPLGLVINELATNALKYGALSTATGGLQVRWTLSAGTLALEWRERDGPQVRANGIENFGSRLLRRLVEGQLGGELQRSLDQTGVTCRIELPIASLQSAEAQVS